MPTVTFQDLLNRQRGLNPAFKTPVAPEPTPPTPHSFQSAETTPDLSAAFAKLDEMSARLDALIERNGRWARYITGGES